MLDIKILNKIKPGDEVVYETSFLDIKETIRGVVIEVACRSGFDENGNIDLDDYIIVNDGGAMYGIDEIRYTDIKDVKFKNESN